MAILGKQSLRSSFEGDVVQSSVRMPPAGFHLKSQAGLGVAHCPQPPDFFPQELSLPSSRFISRAVWHSKALEKLAAHLRELKDKHCFKASFRNLGKLSTIFLFSFGLPIGTMSVLEWMCLLPENTLWGSPGVWPCLRVLLPAFPCHLQWAGHTIYQAASPSPYAKGYPWVRALINMGTLNLVSGTALQKDVASTAS